MSTEDEAFLVRARQEDNLNAKPSSFGLAMMELVATDPVPLSIAISALLATDEPIVEPLAVPEDEAG